MNKPNPCPFCNSKKTAMNYSYNCFYVLCLNCGAEGPKVLKIDGYTTQNKQKFKSLEKWNER